MSSDNERGRPRQAVPSKPAAAKQADNGSHPTPFVGRLTWTGHGGLTTRYANHVGWLDSDLRRALRDTEGAALAIFDAIGPQQARSLARELLTLAQEVA